jgi:gamma-glutamylputrescine oxidase
MVTEPLGKRIREICGPHPVCDDRLSLSYYRILPDSRLLWGGLACAFPIKSTQKQIKLLRQDMLQAYPQLEDIKIDYVWGGKLAFGWDLMPLIQEKNGIWQVSGFGGHGLIPTTLCGSLVACAISSNYADTRWKILSESFQPKYTGWPFTTFWTFLYLKAFQLRDYFVFKFQKRD